MSTRPLIDEWDFTSKFTMSKSKYGSFNLINDEITTTPAPPPQKKNKTKPAGDIHASNVRSEIHKNRLPHQSLY